LNYNHVDVTDIHVRSDPYCIDSWTNEIIEQVIRIETDEEIIEGKELKRGRATASDFSWRDWKTNSEESL
jgi:hypothetical protein